MWCGVVQCGVVWCSVIWCVAVCCCVLQCLVGCAAVAYIWVFGHVLRRVAPV